MTKYFMRDLFIGLSPTLMALGAIDLYSSYELDKDRVREPVPIEVYTSRRDMVYTYWDYNKPDSESPFINFRIHTRAIESKRLSEMGVLELGIGTTGLLALLYPYRRKEQKK